METDKGTITIETSSDNRKRVIFAPVNGTIRMAKCELVALFGVYTQTINACIEAILKTGVPDVEATCKCHLIANAGKGTCKIRYEPYEFNLEFIIAMAFRIDSENAEILRLWIVSQILAEKTILLPASLLNVQKHEWN